MAERSWPLWKSSSANIFNNFRMSHPAWLSSRNPSTKSLYLLRVGQGQPLQEGDTSLSMSQVWNEIHLFSLHFRAFYHLSGLSPCKTLRRVLLPLPLLLAPLCLDLGFHPFSQLWSPDWPLGRGECSLNSSVKTWYLKYENILDIVAWKRISKEKNTAHTLWFQCLGVKSNWKEGDGVVNRKEKKKNLLRQIVC